MGAAISIHPHRARSTRSSARTTWLYFKTLFGEFRSTLVALAAAVLLGSLLYALALRDAPGGPSCLTCLYAAWMALLGEPAYSPPPTWYTALVNGTYPLVGFVLIGEGVVRFAMLMISRRQGEKEWMRVMASTYHDHVVLCGLGHLGFRVLERLVSGQVPAVVLEKDPNGRFVALAKAMGVPVLIRDMKDDQALIEAGIERARIVIIATNDDMANLEVAMDSRRMNPRIRIVMRLFDQQIASKISGAFTIDAAFSATALAAPLVVALSLEANVLSSIVIGGVQHVTSQLTVSPGSPLAGRRVAELERELPMRILSRTANGAHCFPLPEDQVETGDALVIHCRAADLAAIADSALAAV